MTSLFDDERLRRQAAAAIRRAVELMRAEPTLTASAALTEAFGGRIQAWEPDARPKAFTAINDVLTRRLDPAVEAAMTAAADRLDGADGSGSTL